MKKLIYILFGERATGKSILLNLLDKKKVEIIDDIILTYDPKTGIDTGKELIEKIYQSKKDIIAISVCKSTDEGIIVDGIIFDKLQLLTDRLKGNDNYLVTICNLERK